jgi:hypothetical protein
VATLVFCRVTQRTTLRIEVLSTAVISKRCVHGNARCARVADSVGQTNVIMGISLPPRFSHTHRKGPDVVRYVLSMKPHNRFAHLLDFRFDHMQSLAATPVIEPYGASNKLIAPYSDLVSGTMAHLSTV